MPNPSAPRKAKTVTRYREQEALEALIAWDATRRERLVLQVERRAHQCELFDAGDNSVGDFGHPACWGSGGEIADMCEPCQKRTAITAHVNAAKKAEAKLRQRMQRLAGKLQPGLQLLNAQPPSRVKKGQ